MERGHSLVSTKDLSELSRPGMICDVCPSSTSAERTTYKLDLRPQLDETSFTRTVSTSMPKL